MCLQFKSFENTGKEDVNRKEQFLLFQQYFYRHLGAFSTILMSANSFSMGHIENLSFGKE